MQNDPYVEKVIRDFNARNPDYVDAHDARLSAILDHIKDLSSPAKEERLVELIVNCEQGFPLSESSPQGRSAADLPGAESAVR